jgi:glycosyltransferase involved in cell wall biosynthesis
LKAGHSDTIVTVVVGTRDRCELLKETVDSVFQQTMDKWELIVVDDASRDGTWSWLESIVDSRVRPIRLDEHGERSKARNTGLAAANGQFVLFLDDDDLLTPDALQIHVDAMRHHPEVIVTVGGMISFDASGKRVKKNPVKRCMVRDVFYDLLFAWAIIGGQSCMRTESVRAVNGWNESYNFAEDLELTLRLAELGPFCLTPEFVINYRIHESQWRPRQGRKFLVSIRETAADRQGPKRRRRAMRVIQASRHLRLSKVNRHQGKCFRAVIESLKLLILVPGMLMSPLIRRKVIWALAGSLACSFRGGRYRPRVASGTRFHSEVNRGDPKEKILPGQLDEIE